MPTYDYVCRQCGHSFELFQSMSAKVKRKCPECGERKLERLIGTGAAIIFKGSGFYETDYRSDSYKKAAAADSKQNNGKSETKESKTSAESTTAKSSETKSDSKSDSKSGGKSDKVKHEKQS